MLIETCKVYPQHGPKAAELLFKAAPTDSISPALIPQLSTEMWARPVLEAWRIASDIPENAKRAIEQQMKKRGS